MTEPVDRKPRAKEPRLPEEFLPGVERLREKFRLLKEGNRAAYLATTEEQFVTRVEEDSSGIADQRTYLMHQVEHSYTRARVLRGDLISALPPLESLNRQNLIDIWEATTQGISVAFMDPSVLWKNFYSTLCR